MFYTWPEESEKPSTGSCSEHLTPAGRSFWRSSINFGRQGLGEGSKLLEAGSGESLEYAIPGLCPTGSLHFGLPWCEQPQCYAPAMINQAELPHLSYLDRQKLGIKIFFLPLNHVFEKLSLSQWHKSRAISVSRYDSAPELNHLLCTASIPLDSCTSTSLFQCQPPGSRPRRTLL